MKAESNMAGYVVDELALIADLFNDTPVECGQIFRQAGLQTADLLTINQENFKYRLSLFPHDVQIDKIWESIVNWRIRNVSICFLSLKFCFYC